MPDGSLSPISDIRYDFDASGPRFGPVQLLENTLIGFVPIPSGTLEQHLAKAFSERVDCSAWSWGLAAICRAMNDGDLAKAAFATVFLPKPHVIAADDDRLLKAGQDPDHPGWPKGTPDGKGGEFMPKTGDAADNLRIETRKARIERLKNRRKFRSIVRRILSAKRVARLLAEVAVDLIPLDAVSETATVADLTLLARDIAAEVDASQAALDFAETGPQALEDLLISKENLQFNSYRDLVKIELEVDLDKRFGPAGDGYQYHHIVEQGPNASNFTQAELQSTSNVMKLPTIVHEEVSAAFSRTYKFSTGDMTLREFLRGASFERQRAWGLWAISYAGALSK